VLVVLLPLNLLLPRRRPRDLGLEADGEPLASAEPTDRPSGRRWTIVDEEWAARDWTLRSATATTRFWLLFAGLGAATFAQQLLIVHQVAYLIDANQPKTMATAFILAFPLLMLVGSTGSYPLLVLYAALVGIGLGTIGPIAPGMVADIFSGRSYGEIFGAIVISTGLGAALGAWLAGWVFDVTGDYRVAFGAAVLSAALAITLCWLAAPRKVRRVSGVGC
jgi:MFS family permease